MEKQRLFWSKNILLSILFFQSPVTRIRFTYVTVAGDFRELHPEVLTSVHKNIELHLEFYNYKLPGACFSISGHIGQQIRHNPDVSVIG